MVYVCASTCEAIEFEATIIRASRLKCSGRTSGGSSTLYSPGTGRDLDHEVELRSKTRGERADLRPLVVGAGTLLVLRSGRNADRSALDHQYRSGIFGTFFATVPSPL
jgi:hypothetical protein